MTQTQHPDPSTEASEARTTAVSSRDRWRTVGAPVLAAVTVLALIVGVLLGWLAFAHRTPGDSSVDAGFARDMSEHHAQAIEMSILIIEDSQGSENRDVLQLAIDIAHNQATERGMMITWLQEWGLPFASADGERMAWMEHDHHGAEALPPGVSMAGMASPAEIQELTEATGEEAEILFLQLMTTHHIAGVGMAEDALQNASSPQVKAAAQRMVNAQFGEVNLMDDLLARRDAEPREDIEAWAEGQLGNVTEDHDEHDDH